MSVKSREDLKALRMAAKTRLSERDAAKPKIMVGLGTCGIAAGAQGVYDAIVEELGKRQIQATMVKTGCIGMCVREPLVDVQLPGGERITYGNVQPEDVARIIEEHVVRGGIVADLAIARFVQV